MRDFFHHLLLPHHTNNHRAKILHHTSLLVLVILLLIGNVVLSVAERSYSTILGITADYNQDDLLLQTNAKRAEHGLPPLQLNSQLSTAAYQKGQDMLAKNYWAHNAPDGTTPWVFFRNNGYEYLYAGENLARGYESAEKVVNAWMDSQGHKENILSANYDDVGFAVLTGTLNGDETILVVQEFGRKMTGGPATQTIAVNPSPQPTVAQAPVVTVRPTRTPSPTTTVPPIVARVSPTDSPVVTVPPEPTESFSVASVQSNPLVDSKTFSKNFSVLLIVFFISVLIMDIIVIERKNIVRLLSHNVDHILFFIVILLVLLTVGRGVVL